MTLLVGGRFRGERLLKESQGIETWLAWENESQVVVKLAPAPSDLGLRLAYEAESLAQLRCNHIPRLHAFGRDDRQCYLAVEFVAGQTLAEKLSSHGPLSLGEFFELAKGLLTALEAVHQRGILHRDVKPANLVLAERGPCLIDFGLSNARTHDWLAGTVLYASPESTGLLCRDVGEGSDLYSAGALFFESLTGRPPFLGTTAGEVLRQHLSSPVPSLRALCPDAPSGLQWLLERLLAKEPEERYANAASARLDIESLQRGESLFRGTETRRVLTRSPLVGRQSELEAIATLFPQGGMLLLTAPTGGGKSRLLDAVAQDAVTRGALLLRGQATSVGLPFQILQGPIHELVLSHPPGLAEAAGPWRDDLVQAFPSLGRVLPGAASTISEEQGHFRVLQGLSAVLEAIGQPQQPAVLLLDDAQWADSTSLELLVNLSRTGCPPHLILLVACRSDELPEALQTWAAARLTLPPLEADSSRQLLESMAGPLPQTLLDWLESYAEGNPFLLVEGLRGAFQEDGDYQTSLRSAVLLEQRLNALEPLTRQLLRQGALLGRSFRLGTIALWSGLPLTEILQALAQARQLKLLWGDASGTRFTLAHDRIREKLLDVPLLELHQQAVQALRRDPQATVFELAYHSHQIGPTQVGREYALEAARQCRQRYQFRMAAQYYQMALAVEPDDVEVREGRARVLFYAGRSLESLQEFRTLLPLRQTPLDRANDLRWMGLVALEMGDPAEVIQLCQQALRELGQDGLLNRSPWQLAGAYGRAMLRRSTTPPPPGEIRQEALLAVQILNLLGTANFHSGLALRGIYYCLRAVEYAQKNPTGWQLGWLWTHYSTIAAHLAPMRPVAASFCARGLELMHSQGADELSVCQALARSVVYRMNSESALSLVPFLEALQARLLSTGDMWEWAVNIHIGSLVLYAAGCFESLLCIGNRLHKVASGLDSPRTRAIALNLLARVGPEPLPRARWELDFNRLDTYDAMTRVHLRMAAGLTALREQRFEEAVEVLRPRTGESSALNDDLMQRLWWCEALRRWADSLPLRSQKRPELYALARRSLYAANRMARFGFPFLLPRVWRELGLVELALGKTRAGLSRLRESLQRATKYEHAYEEALTRLELARWREAQSETEAAADMQKALQDLNGMGAVWHQAEEKVPAAVGQLLPVQPQEFHKLLSWGVALTQELDAARVGQTLLDSAAQLLPCRRTSLSSGQAASASSSLVIPIEAYGSRLGLLELDPSRPFGTGEHRLAEFLSCLAGAAWEKDLRHERLQHSQMRLATAFQAAAVGLAVVDASYCVQQSNAGFAAILGQPDCVGQNLHQLLGPSWPSGSGQIIAVARPDSLISLCQCSLIPMQERWLVTLADVTHQNLEPLALLQETERRLLAAEIHDSVLQDVTALRVRLELLGSAEAAGESTQALWEDLSRLVVELRNPVAEGESLYLALRAYLNRFGQQTGVPVRARLTEVRLANPLPLFAYRMVQSALENVHLQEQVTQVRVLLRWTPQGLLGRVWHDGLAPTGASRRGLRFRAESLGGWSRVRSTKKGVRISFLLPGSRC